MPLCCNCALGRVSSADRIYTEWSSSQKAQRPPSMLLFAKESLDPGFSLLITGSLLVGSGLVHRFSSAGGISAHVMWQSTSSPRALELNEALEVHGVLDSANSPLDKLCAHHRVRSTA
eukprot:scaffold49712_cov34-Tisochrysis_lutea.AAC.1